MNIISTIFGIVGLIIALIGLIPLLGWLNWLAIFISAIGFLISIFSRYSNGRNLNLFVFILAIFRLMMGGGII